MFEKFFNPSTPESQAPILEPQDPQGELRLAEARLTLMQKIIEKAREEDPFSREVQLQAISLENIQRYVDSLRQKIGDSGDGESVDPEIT